MTIEQLLIENQEILYRMKNEEWDTGKFIKELKGEKKMNDYKERLSTLTNEELIDEAYYYMNDAYYDDLHRMIIREMKKRFVKPIDNNEKE